MKRKDKFLNHQNLLSRVLIEVLALGCLIFVNKDIMHPFHSNRCYVEVEVVVVQVVSVVSVVDED